MFDYIERCRNELGANVVVADPTSPRRLVALLKAGDTAPPSCPLYIPEQFTRTRRDRSPSSRIVWRASAVAFLFKDKPQCREIASRPWL